MKFVFVQLLPLAMLHRSVVALPLSYGSTLAATPSRVYVPLLVVFVCLFFLLVVFLAIKLVYMKHRRIGTIHAPPGVPTISQGVQLKGNRHRGLLVGCLGSPAWETSLTSKLDGTAWRRQQRRRSSFAYQLHTRSTICSTHAVSPRARSKNSSSGSRFTKSTALASCSSHTDQFILSSIPGIPLHQGGSSSKAVVQQNTLTEPQSRYGDFGELRAMRSPTDVISNVARRASPSSSIRLVDGPSHSSQVEYSFLTALPPNAIVTSPLMGTRDSIQLSSCSLKCSRKPVPPLPSLPSFLPFYLSNGPGHDTLESRPVQAHDHLPPLRFSPLASVVKVFQFHQHASEKKSPSSRVPESDENADVAHPRTPCPESAPSSKIHHTSNAGSLTSPCVGQEIPISRPILNTNVTKPSSKRSRSYKGLAIGGSLSQTSLITDSVTTSPLEDKTCDRDEAESKQTGVPRIPSGSSRNDSVASKKPLKSCLRQHSAMLVLPISSSGSTFSPSMSETSIRTYGTRQSTGEQASIRTPISDNDIGLLGLDRFRWNDEIKELKVQSSHLKKDSIALVPLWE